MLYIILRAEGLVTTKRYSWTVILVFLTGIRNISYQEATQLPSQGWVDPIPQFSFREKNYSTPENRHRNLWDGS